MKLLVSDYDGTFATGFEDIKINCKMLKKFIEKGNTFVLSSGRSFESLKRQVEMHDIPYSYLATADGNFLFDKNDKNIMKYTIKHDIIDKLDDLKKIEIYDRIDYTYEREYSTIYDSNRELGSVSVLVKDDNLTDEFLNAFNKLKDENPDYEFAIYGYNGLSFYMIRKIGINKSTPIKFLEKKLKIPSSKIFTVGDNVNDLEMIRDYNGFVIGNHKEVVPYALKEYDSVHSLVKDINKKKVLRRW